MNKHIELVKKWLADPASVSQQELEDNANNAATSSAANEAAYAVYRAAYRAANAATDAYVAYTDATAAAHWVRRYEELTK
jgi:hypothetical protein